MTAWWSGSAVLFDLESDDREPTDARIITACVAYVQPNREIVKVTPMARPERPINPEATAIHGITTAHADEHGLAREVVVNTIATCLAMPDAGPVIGHNVKYDLTLIDREMRRTGVGSLGVDGDLVMVRIDGRQVGAFHVIDTLVIDKQVDPYRKGRRTLEATAQHYGVPIRGDAHTAEADALAAGRVAWAIARRCDASPAVLDGLYGNRRDPGVIAHAFRDLGAMTLPELHRNQIRWAEQQATGLAEYFERNPDRGDPATVSYHWPLEPVGTVDAVTDLV